MLNRKRTNIISKLCLMLVLTMITGIMFGTTAFAAKQKVTLNFSTAIAKPAPVTVAYGTYHMDAIKYPSLGLNIPASNVDMPLGTFTETLELQSTNTTWEGKSGWTYLKGASHSFSYSNTNRVDCWDGLGFMEGTGYESTSTYWEFEIPSANTGDTISFGNTRIYLGEELTDNLGNSAKTRSDYGLRTITVSIICEDGTEDVIGTVKPGTVSTGAYISYYLGSLPEYTVSTNGAKTIRISDLVLGGYHEDSSLEKPGANPLLNWESNSQQVTLNYYVQAEGQITIGPADSEGPTISVSGNPTSWVNSATLNVSASDPSGLASAAYSWNYGAWTTSTSYTVSANQTVNVRAMDSLGNISSQNVVVTYIDNTSPVISAVSGEGNSSSYAKSRTITITASDAGIGLHPSGAYCFDGTNWTTNNSYTYTGTMGTTVVKVRDAFGYVTERTISVYTDNTAPILSSVSGNPSKFQKTSCTITVSANDGNSGLNASAYSFNGGTWQSANTFTVDENMTVSIRIRDKVGNILETSYVINKIDKDAPEILSVSGNPTSWTTSTTLIIDASDTGVGLASKPYSWDGGNTWTSSGAKTFNQNGLVEIQVKDALDNVASKNINIQYIDMTSPTLVSITGEGSSTSFAKSRTITVIATDDGIGLDGTGAYCFDGITWTTNNTYTYYGTMNTAVIKVRDGLGLETQKTIAVYTDNTLPVLAGVTGNPATYQSADCTITVDAADANAGLHDKAYSFNGGDWQSENTFVVGQNMSLAIKIRDKVGNEISTTYQITNIDKTPPNILSVTGNPSSWTNSAMLVINAADAGIGLAEAPYSWDGGKTWTEDTTKVYNKNEVVEIQVKDALENISKKTVDVKYIDTTSPTIISVSGEGNETNWAQSRTVTIQAEDLQSGLSSIGGYCFDGNNWQTENSYEYNGTVAKATIRVRDNLGQISSKTINVYVDNTPPVISKIEGNPEEWQNVPCIVTVTATDSASGLAPLAYNFNDEGWQTSNTYEVENNMTVQVSVMDTAGNIAEKNYKITKVDTSGPTLSVSYPSITDDKQFVVTALYGVDNTSKKILYCFDYKEDGSEEPYWTESNQQAIKSGTELVVACKDELGNITTQTICPTAKSVHSGGGTKIPIFTKNVISCGSYILGGAASGKYMDKAGTVRNYQAYSVNGAEISGIAITVSAAPSNGGILSGYAKIMGQEFPIYWDSAFTTTTTSNEGQGTIIIDAGKLSQSTRNDTLTIVINEFEDASMDNILNSDSLKTNISIDTTPPVTNIFYNKATQNVEVTTKDTISGLATVKYRITTAEGTGEWQDYTTPFSLTARSQIEIEAVDKLGNTTNQSSVWLEPQNPAVNRGDGEGLPDYRSYYFDYYIEGV